MAILTIGIIRGIFCTAFPYLKLEEKGAGLYWNGNRYNTLYHIGAENCDIDDWLILHAAAFSDLQDLWKNYDSRIYFERTFGKEDDYEYYQTMLDYFQKIVDESAEIIKAGAPTEEQIAFFERVGAYSHDALGFEDSCRRLCELVHYGREIGDIDF